MAIRDRITVTTKLGTVIVINARFAGGSVEFNKQRDWTTVSEISADAQHSVIREAHVQTPEVVSIVRDREPLVQKRPPRKPKAE